MSLIDVQDLESVVSGEEVKLINQGIKVELPTISLTMIVRDEEEHLPQCLELVKDVVDEIIIVDTGSKDKTVEIAKKYTDKIYHYEIPKIIYQDKEIEDLDFSVMRNFADSHATCDWILTLDADERMKAEYIQTLKTIIAQRPQLIACEFPIFNQYDEKNYSQHRRFKAYKNHVGIHYRCVLHETIGDSLEGKGESALVPIPIIHLGYGDSDEHRKRALTRNIPILEKAVEREPDNYFYLYYLGKSYMTAVNDDEKAKKYLEKSLKYSKKYIGVHLETKFYLGNIALKEGKITKAIEYYNQVIAGDPTYPDVHFIMGAIYLDRGKYDIALPFLEHAFKNQSNMKSKINILKVFFSNKQILEKMQLAAARCGEFEKASRYLIQELEEGVK